MSNIFIYEGHSSQNIVESSEIIKTGDELFNKTRIKVPEGFRFITFHFNDKITTANSTGPFILYGMKEITEEDIESLFNVESNCELEYNYRQDKKIICKNERDKNIKMFKRKMFKSFVIHYINFMSTIYNNSITKEFDYNIKKEFDHDIKKETSIFDDYKSLEVFIKKFVETNFIKICEIHNITVDEYKIKGEINRDYILNLCFFDLIKEIDFVIICNKLSDNQKKKIFDELSYKEKEKIYNKLSDNQNEKNNKIKKYRNFNLNTKEKLNEKIKNEFIQNIQEYIDLNNLIKYLKKQKKEENNNLYVLIDDDIIKIFLKDKLKEYYGDYYHYFIDLFMSHYQKDIETTIDDNWKLIIMDLFKKKIINILLNIVRETKPSNYENKPPNYEINNFFKDIGNIKSIIIDDNLEERFYNNLFTLLLSTENILSIQNDNCEEILNYIFLDNILYDHNKIQELKSNPWSINNTSLTSNSQQFIYKPLEALKESIDKFDEELIDDICNYFNFKIRSYKSNTLTPILSFNDILSFNINGLYNTYKYGFFKFDDYKNISELCHYIYDRYPSRSINYGLSRYSYEENIPQELIFTDKSYYSLIIKYYENFCYLFNFIDDDLSYIFVNDDNQKVKQKIVDSRQNITDKMISEVKQKINEINDDFDLNNDDFDLNNDEYNIQEINLLWYFIYLYRTLHFAKIDLDICIKYLKYFLDIYDKLILIFDYYKNFCQLFNFNDDDLRMISTFDNFKDDDLRMISTFDNSKDHNQKVQNKIFDSINKITDKNIEIVEYTIKQINDDFNLNFDMSTQNLINIQRITNFENLLWYFIYYYRILYFAKNNDLHKCTINMKSFLTIYLNYYKTFKNKDINSFFNYLEKGTYIITSCGSFSSELKKVYESLDENEKLKFNKRTQDYDTYWRKKYLKYKEKYLKYKEKYLQLKSKYNL